MIKAKLIQEIPTEGLIKILLIVYDGEEKNEKFVDRVGFIYENNPNQYEGYYFEYFIDDENLVETHKDDELFNENIKFYEIVDYFLNFHKLETKTNLESYLVSDTPDIMEFIKSFKII